jgi:CheY-like chemotaxis protein
MARAYVVIVDDSETARGMLQMVFEAQDLEVSAAADGGEALALIEGRRPDLIVTDGVMPGVDGPTFVRRLKVNPATSLIPVIALTSGEPGEWQTGEGGPQPDAILRKSPDFAALVARVNQFLTRLPPT